MTSVAVIQLAAPWSSAQASRAHTERLLHRAAAGGARLAVLPELCTMSYNFRARGEIGFALDRVIVNQAVDRSAVGQS